MQPHVRKCFECIKSLEVKEGGKEGRKVFEVVGMNSPEKELVNMKWTHAEEGSYGMKALYMTNTKQVQAGAVLHYELPEPEEKKRPLGSGGTAVLQAPNKRGRRS